MLITKLWPLVALIISLGVGFYNFSVVLANEVVIGKNNFPGDGVYLYGQSPQTQQLGREYLVFQLTQSQVEGAFYLPGSEFSCFSGEVKPERMKLAVVDTYRNDIYSYSIPLQRSSPLASEGNTIEHPLGLVGYHHIPKISKNDRRILDICLQKAN